MIIISVVPIAVSRIGRIVQGGGDREVCTAMSCGIFYMPGCTYYLHITIWGQPFDIFAYGAAAQRVDFFLINVYVYIHVIFSIFEVDIALSNETDMNYISLWRKCKAYKIMEEIINYAKENVGT